jgi:hypothetical protein
MHFPPFFSSGGALRIYEALDPLLLETNQLIVDRAGGWVRQVRSELHLRGPQAYPAMRST